MVRQDDPGDRAGARKRDFEWIPFRVARDWTGDDQACLGIVGARRQDQSRSPTPLLMPGLRIEREPHQIAGVRDIRAGYHTS